MTRDKSRTPKTYRKTNSKIEPSTAWSIIMAKVIAQITVKLPRLMEVSEYRKLRYAGGKPSVQQLKKWIEEGEVIGEIKGGMYFVDLQAAVTGSNDPLLAKMMEVV